MEAEIRLSELDDIAEGGADHLPEPAKLSLLLKQVAALKRDFDTQAASTQQRLDDMAKGQGVDAAKVLHVQRVPKEGGSSSYGPA